MLVVKGVLQMKKPNKPRKPSRPQTPQKYHNIQHYVCLYEDKNYTLEELLNICKKENIKFQNDLSKLSYKDIWIECIKGDDWYDFELNVRFKVDVVNQNFEEDKLKYNKKLKVYKNKIREYEDKILKYKSELKEYLKFIKNKEKETLEKELIKLQNKLKNT